ncbi:glycine/sarcosine/betaine reductase complex component C subunit beta [Gallibacter sp. Marseille-QA0791]|uniref:glycine/sarcosine/betaine reductase complex component C subunit beta n=1 Tax=Gallibacter sp. Marseille-QA0791 TaxID=3378781 RepID=UPI003D0E2369
MGGYAVLKGTSYTLAATPDMVLYNGTTQTTERTVNPESEYLKAVPSHLRSYEDIVEYLPNQVYIGNRRPEELSETEFPWYDKKCGGTREGKYGEIMPQDEFFGLIQICDVFDLVKLEKTFAEEVEKKLAAHELIGAQRAAILNKNADTTEEELAALVEEEHAEPLYNGGKLVGAVKRAHDIDVNLSAHVMLENLVTKASSVLSLMHLVKNTGIDPSEIEYVIDCCEEACGDMNQRGGGNFAKAAAEVAGLTNATGSDVRGFCAGPSHALLNAASLVKAGTFKTVAVTAGGCTAKLGMNGKDHVKKEMPILEDAIAGFAVLITADDGVSPMIRTDITGRHTVGTGSSPQAVIGSLVTDPIDAAGLKLTDVDKFSPEMQNPDITKPAGAGDVPEANYKMIAALGVKRGDIERKDIPEFVKKHGMTGWAPTQGHIPSGVPYLGFAREDMLEGKIRRAMIIGKGSLFLGRMTNLFDGVSFIVEANDGSGSGDTSGVDEERIKELIADAMRSFAEDLLEK